MSNVLFSMYESVSSLACELSDLISWLLRRYLGQVQVLTYRSIFRWHIPL